MKKLVHVAIILVFALFFFAALAGPVPPVEDAKNYLVASGKAETGADNLVTAIYLGYRAFDTLGETIVLITSVAGVVFLMGGKS